MLDYVFEHSTLTRIYATIDAENTASIRVINKLGLRFEKRVTEDDGVEVSSYVIERGQQRGSGGQG